MHRCQNQFYARGIIILPLPYIQGISCEVTSDNYVMSLLGSSTLEKFILPAILFMVMVGLLILKGRIVAMRTTNVKRHKFLESPSDNRDDRIISD